MSLPVLTLGCLLALAAVLPAQIPASYQLFGEGCNGAAVTHCVALNDQSPALTVLTAPNEYAYPFVNTTGAAIQLVGFDAFTVANTGGVQTVASGVLLDAAGINATVPSMPAAGPVSTGRLTATGTPGWCNTTLVPPVTVPSGAVFWLQLESYGRVAPPQHSNGVPGVAAPCYRRPTIGNLWMQSVTVTAPMLRVRCLPANPAIPTMTAVLVPQIGLTFGLTITGGQPLGLAAMIFAYDTIAWHGLPLPLDLAVVGAPGCVNRTSADATLFVGLDAQGGHTVVVALPNIPGLMGMPFFNQVVVTLPAANPLGMLISNAGAGIIGN